MGRTPCCEGASLKRGPWTPEEDQKLFAYIQEHGHGRWRTLPQKAGLQRCGKSCRLRWINYLRPDIKRGEFTLHEEQTIIQLHALLGNRWSVIAMQLPSRTDNEIKNYWNTRLKKRLAKMGIDPVTHRRKGESKNSATLSHIAQWESTRLEAEARLVRESMLRQQHQLNSLASGCNIETHPLPPLSIHLSAQLHNDILKVCGGGVGGGSGGSGIRNNCVVQPPTSTFSSENVEAFIMHHHYMILNASETWTGEPTDVGNQNFSEGYMNLSPNNNLGEWKLSFGDRYSASNGGGSFEENKSCWNDILNNNCGTLDSLVF